MEFDGAWLTIAIVALLLGGLIGAYAFPVEKVQTVEKVVTKEVPKEVVKYETKEVEVNVPLELREQAYEDFLEYLDDEDLFVCDGNEYRKSEVSLYKMYDEYSVSFDGDEYTVKFKTKLRFKEEDESSCKKLFEVEVYYPEDGEPEVTIL